MNMTQPDPAIGMTVGGRYELSALIGRGGMASVYRARDLMLARDVAVKLFRSDGVDGDDRERQRAEIALLASLNHPGLVTLIDAGVDESDPAAPRGYVVMQLIDGSDLRGLLARGTLPPPDEVGQIGADLADALHYVHNNGVIHRDIKPANILLAHSPGGDTRPHPKLSDFGIARIIGDPRMTATGTTLGTAGYLSPEQAAGEDVGPASDIYSLGLVLLECLTGERAFPGPAVEAALARILRQPVIPESLGMPWTATLAAMTARHPDERPSAREVALALRAGEPLTVYQASANPADDSTQAMVADAGNTKPLDASRSTTDGLESTKVMPSSVAVTAGAGTAAGAVDSAETELLTARVASAGAASASGTSGRGSGTATRRRVVGGVIGVVIIGLLAGGVAIAVASGQGATAPASPSSTPSAPATTIPPGKTAAPVTDAPVSNDPDPSNPATTDPGNGNKGKGGKGKDDKGKGGKGK